MQQFIVIHSNGPCVRRVDPMKIKPSSGACGIDLADDVQESFGWDGRVVIFNALQ